VKDIGRISEQQLDILNVLWARGEASAREVHATLEPITGHARKTTGTLLHRLEKQGLVAHHEAGREFMYYATVTREEVQQATVRGMVGQQFHGSLPDMVSYALDAGSVEPDDLARIRAMIEDHERKQS
jgi:predicted transcriptional regulator